jgi:uncharacterized integral membrane protein
VPLFTIFALLLLVVVTLFALGNPQTVTLRFLVWQVETTLALATISGAVLGGLLVFVSSLLGQRHLRAMLREAQGRVRDLEARIPEPGTRHDQPQ